MLVRFIGSNHLTSHELLAFNGLWLGLQAWELLLWMRTRWAARAAVCCMMWRRLITPLRRADTLDIR
jgi:hypothetical protein